MVNIKKAYVSVLKEGAKAGVQLFTTIMGEELQVKVRGPNQKIIQGPEAISFVLDRTTQNIPENEKIRVSVRCVATRGPNAGKIVHGRRERI